jgi:hypothetical protein
VIDLLTIAIAVTGWLAALGCVVALCAAAARADRRELRLRAPRTPQRFPATSDRVVARRTTTPARRARALSH